MVDATTQKQFISYSLIGVANTSLDFLLYAFLTRVFLMHEITAVIIAFILANIQSYVFNARFTFSRSGESLRAHSRRYVAFFLVSILSLACNVSLFAFFHYIFELHDIVSKALATIIVVVLSFSLQKLVTFNTNIIR